MDPEKIATIPELFSKCMRMLFGPGYQIVETSIAKELKEEFGLKNNHVNKYNDLVQILR